MIFAVFKIVKPFIQMRWESRFINLTRLIFGFQVASCKCDLPLCCKLANRLLELLIWHSHKYWKYWTDMVLGSQIKPVVTSCEDGIIVWKIHREKLWMCLLLCPREGGEGHLCWMITCAIIWQFHLSPMFTSSFPFSPSTGCEHSFSPSRPSWIFINDNIHYQIS